MPISHIVVDSTAAIPISSQIIGQILLLITKGELAPGETLPPVVEFAKYLGVNHNTIAAVYDHLSKSGYLFAQRGRGTFVANTQAVEKITSYKQFQELLEKAFQAATVVGLSPSEFTAVAYAQATLLGQSELVLPKVVFVEDRERAPDLFQKLEVEVELPLLFINLEELKQPQSKRREDLVTADLVVTTTQKLWDVTQIATEEQEIIAIESKPTLGLIAELSSLPRRRSILLIGKEKTDGELMQRSLNSSGIYHLDFQILDLSGFKKNRKKLEQFDTICVSKNIEGEVTRYISEDKKLLVFETSIDLTNLSVLKARIAAIQVTNLGCISVL